MKEIFCFFQRERESAKENLNKIEKSDKFIKYICLSNLMMRERNNLYK